MSDARQNETAAELLRRTRVEVAPAPFVLIGMRHEDWTRLLEQPELSPRPTVPFMLLRDTNEVTLLVEEEDWLVMRHALREARVETGWRLVTLDIKLDWNVTGFLAHVTGILAAAGIPLGALTAFSRDHLLIKQDDLGRALRVLGEHVAELC
ncbi:MAG TPA: ACT domain-containing protein [Pyrinomonadaceae bacterium]|nr:ACT domain-containing protein [Pyrinomonadaceae bacterium]